MIAADTIAAISTSVGEAAISVVRLSGPESHAILGRAFLTRQSVSELSPRTTYLGRVVDAEKRVIDHALGILYRAPASYTGEDMVELHCHGGVLVTQKVLGVLLSHGARQADAGEFTQRAFLNGKMDLTQAEAVMDLIHAQSTLAMRAANEQLEGHIGKQADEMRTGLIGILAHVEAYIDFPDEEISKRLRSAVKQLRGKYPHTPIVVAEHAGYSAGVSPVWRTGGLHDPAHPGRHPRAELRNLRPRL